MRAVGAARSASRGFGRDRRSGADAAIVLVSTTRLRGGVCARVRAFRDDVMTDRARAPRIVMHRTQNGTLAEFGRGILDEAEAKKKNSAARAKSAIELMADAEREKQAKKEERKAAKEAKRLARLEKEEFERTGGQVKLSKKERKALALEEEA